MEVLKVDRSGRIVLPKSIREKLGVRGEDHLVLVEHNNTIVLRKLDIEDVAEKIEEELRGFDVEEAFKQIRKETGEKVLEDHPELTETAS